LKNKQGKKPKDFRPLAPNPGPPEFEAKTTNSDGRSVKKYNSHSDYLFFEKYSVRRFR